MSANASTWFYQEPERNAFKITERLNGTFWQARVVDVYWRCVKAEPPFRAEGYLNDHKLTLEWTPGKSVSLKAGSGVASDTLVEAISKRIVAIPVSLTYEDSKGNQVVEWHTDGGAARWKEIQGKAGFRKPQLLSKPVKNRR